MKLAKSLVEWESTFTKSMDWSCCDNEMKMSDFLEKISDEAKLRRFALELACTLLDGLEDKRLIDAVDATEDFLNGAISEADLLRFYKRVESALEEIEAREMIDSRDDVEDDSMEYEKGLVVQCTLLHPAFY